MWRPKETENTPDESYKSKNTDIMEEDRFVDRR